MTHSKNGSSTTSRPASGACAGTMRSIAVFANAAIASSRSASASGSAARTSASSWLVALIAFSHANTAMRLPQIASSPVSMRRSMPRAITGATNGRMRGPTAVVTTSAVLISSIEPRLVRPAVDRAEVGDDGRPAALPDLGDRVRLRRVERVDQRVGDVREHHLVAALVEQLPHESATDVARAEVHRFHAGGR